MAGAGAVDTRQRCNACRTWTRHASYPLFGVTECASCYHVKHDVLVIDSISDVFRSYFENYLIGRPDFITLDLSNVIGRDVQFTRRESPDPQPQGELQHNLWQLQADAYRYFVGAPTLLAIDWAEQDNRHE